MSDEIVVLAGVDEQLLKPDALTDFSSSEEDAAEFVWKSKAYQPAGEAGELVFRRLYLTIVMDGTVELTVTPIVDNTEYSEASVYFSYPGTAGTRKTFILPTLIGDDNFPGYRRGIRGNWIQVKIEATAPTSRWHVDGLEVAAHVVKRGKGPEVAA